MRLILFTRYPQAGAAKTRLIPLVGANGAARIHRRLTERTVATLAAVAADDDRLELEVHYTGASEPNFACWLGAGHRYVAQSDGDLSDRLLHAADRAPMIYFGADTVELSADIVRSAVLTLSDHDVVIGPAADGGYYLIGMRKAHPELFQDIPWSTEQVLPKTLRRIDQLGLSCRLLTQLRDCDRPEDLRHWPWLTA